jgi:hypothetical protein
MCPRCNSDDTVLATCFNEETGYYSREWTCKSCGNSWDKVSKVFSTDRRSLEGILNQMCENHNGE